MACDPLAEALAWLASAWDVIETETDSDADKDSALACEAETCADVLMADSLISLTLAMDVDMSETEASLRLAADSEITTDWSERTRLD